MVSKHAVDTLSKEEQKWAYKVIKSIGNYLQTRTEKDLSPRMFHPEMHGLVYAEFIINPDLEDKNKVGLFSEAKTYPAWIRFSNSTQKPDIKHNTRGMAIKILGLPDDPWLPANSTQDFLVVNVPTLAAKNYKIAAGAILALTGNIFTKLWFAVRNIPALIQSLKSHPCFNLLQVPYYSQAPSSFGGAFVKFTVVPKQALTDKAPDYNFPDFLRAKLSEDLMKADAWFDFNIQFQENPKTEPIENLSVVWKTPFHKIASIRIPAQQINSDKQRRFGQTLAYNPFNSLEVLKPASAVSRLRGLVYDKMAELRHQRTGELYIEPGLESLKNANLISGTNTFYDRMMEIVNSMPAPIVDSDPDAQMPENLKKLEKAAQDLEVELMGKPYFMTDKKVYQDEFTCFTIIKVGGTYKNDLEKLLTEIGSNINKNKHIPFSSNGIIHFCRWFIIDKAEDTDGTLLPPTLVFNAIFDGGRDLFFTELFKHWGPGIDKIYAFCEGYPVTGSTSDKKAYMLQNKNLKKVAWAAKVGGTVSMIRQEAILNDTIQALVDYKFGAYRTKDLKPRDIYEHIRHYIVKHPALHFCLVPEPGPSFGRIGSNVIRAIANIFVVHLLLVPMLLPILFLGLPAWWFFLCPVLILFILALIFELIENQYVEPPVSKPLTDILEGEDRIFQNQLTVYGTLKRPNLFHTNLLRFGLIMSSLTGRYKATKGNLGGIATIHFLGWHIFNKGRNAMFLSNYDGGWESYLSEFIDFGGWVMNLNFGNIKGYPKIKWLFWSGAYNEQVFKTTVRDYQFPCQIWYSAYPNLSIKNKLNNAKIRQQFSLEMTDQEIEEWLQLL